MSILAYNGGCVVAMKGKDCVAIAADRRFGIQGQTIDTHFERIFEMGPRLYLGLPGLATDTQTVPSGRESDCKEMALFLGNVCANSLSKDHQSAQRLRFRVNLYELREARIIKPKTFSAVVSNLLYERRFSPYFVEPIVVGLTPKNFEPYICSMDLIGCPNEPEDFVVAGTCSEQLYGMCETLWEPNLEPDDLYESISQALVNAVDRDAISGWGAVVYIIEKDKVTVRSVKTRQD